MHRKIIALKVANPDATLCSIAQKVGVHNSTVFRTLQDARERGLLMTDKETQDFFTVEVLQEAARSHRRNIETVRSQLEEWEAIEKENIGDGQRISSEGRADSSVQRRKLSNALAEAASRAVLTRNAIIGAPASAQQGQSGPVVPVVINFVRSDSRPMAPISRENVPDAILMPPEGERAS